MLHLNCFAIGYFATFLFSVSETSKRQKVVIVFVNQNAVHTETMITPHQSKVLNSTTKGSYKSRFLIQNLPVINERKYLYEKVTTFQLLLKSRVETHVPIPKIKYVMGVSKLQVSKNDDEEHCFLK